MHIIAWKLKADTCYVHVDIVFMFVEEKFSRFTCDAMQVMRDNILH